jgi:hypothetical protein
VRPVHTAVAVAAAHYGVRRDIVVSGTGVTGRVTGVHGKTQECRHVTRWLARRLGASMLHIAYYVGLRDHSAVVNSLQYVERRRGAEPAFAAVLDELLSRAQEITRKCPAYAGAGSENAVARDRPDCTVRSTAA